MDFQNSGIEISGENFYGIIYFIAYKSRVKQNIWIKKTIKRIKIFCRATILRNVAKKERFSIKKARNH